MLKHVFLFDRFQEKENTTLVLEATFLNVVTVCLAILGPTLDLVVDIAAKRPQSGKEKILLLEIKMTFSLILTLHLLLALIQRIFQTPQKISQNSKQILGAL